MSDAGALSGLRVLDLTDYRAQLAGRLLADMGAEVVKVEPVGGDHARRIGPFLDDIAHPERSLFHWYYNLNKRSLTLDIDSPRGAEILIALARCADVIIESDAPGAMARRGLGWERLHRENPALVLCSMTPFGQTGPYSGFVADDTTLAALGGMLYVNGYPGRAPVRPLGLQAYHSSSYFAAIAIMIALLARDETSEGQWIDLSMQASTAAAVEHVAGSYFERKEVEPRRGTLHWSRFFRVGKCRDGYIMHCTLGDWTSLIEWVKADGKAGDLIAPEYEQVLYRMLMADHLFDTLDEWVKDYDRDDLLERAQLLRQPYATVRNPEQLFEDEQLAARGFFVEVEHPELGRTIRYPGAPYVFNGTPWRAYRRPPLVGEHTQQILRDWAGLDASEIPALFGQGII
jgi:benzylsuccinate CoA-transferase BbsE subunit